MRQKIPFLKNFNWRLLLVRILINAVALLIVTALLPTLRFVDLNVRTVVLLAIGLGVLNALIKPILQVVTFQFVFASYGLLLVLINALLLYLLAFLFPNRYEVSSLVGALVGGALLGLLASAMEAVLGTTLPIVPETETELRARLEGKTSSISYYIDQVSSAEEAKKAEQKLVQAQASAKPGTPASQAQPAQVPDLPEAADVALEPVSPDVGTELAAAALEEPAITPAEREDASQLAS